MTTSEQRIVALIEDLISDGVQAGEQGRWVHEDLKSECTRLGVPFGGKSPNISGNLQKTMIDVGNMKYAGIFALTQIGSKPTSAKGITWRCISVQASPFG